MRISKKHLAYLAVPITGVAIIGGIYVRNFALASAGHDGDEPEPVSTAVEQSVSVGVETVVDASVSGLNTSSYSWPGEVLSATDVRVHPSREGQISEWRVKLGQGVKKGQVIGRLTPPPATLELSSALAERSQAIIRARAQADATEKLAQDARGQLERLKLVLDRNRDASLQVAEREAEQTLRSREGASQELIATESNKEASLEAAQAELDQAKSTVPLKRQALRVAIERLTQRTAGRLSYSGTSPSTSAGAANMSFKWGVGVTNSAAQDNYRRALAQLLDATKDPSALPDEIALAYVKATQDLLASTIGGTENLPQSELNEIRTELTDDQKDMIEALNEYKEAQSVVALKQAELIKIRSERDKELATARTASLNTDIAVQSSTALKNKLIAEADTEYAKEKADLDSKVNELNREIAMAQAEVRGAEAAYGIVASGVAGQDIIATQTGVVSAVFKNIGDHVSPETPLIGLSSEKATDRFVRFRVPSDMRTPLVGEEVKVELPGFPFGGKKAKVVGVGLALDEKGFYAADAEFTEAVDWPVHASARVTPTIQIAAPILVPFTALWWDDKGVSNVWLVMENGKIRPQPVKVGKAVSDRVEVTEGLEIGSRFVMRTHAGLKTGQSVSEISQTTKQENGTEPAGDGHDHSHE
jgi:multidrug efflux pump subunit AcrA (membrane-fusion protein)